MAKRREGTYDEFFRDTVKVLLVCGPKLYTFDPKWRGSIRRLVTDLRPLFPDYEIVAIPGSTDDWPQIQVGSFDVEF